MSKIKKILLGIVVISLGLSFNPVYAQSTSGTGGSTTNNATNRIKTLCEEWSEKNKESKKVCTDLIEGVPLYLVQNKKDGSECYPANGGKIKGIKGFIPGGPVPIPDLDIQGAGEVCYALISPTGLGGINSYIAMIYTFSGWTIGILGVLMLIISGIQISIGGASADQVNKGKARIVQIIGGMVLFALIGVILRTINPNFFQ